MSEFAKLYQDNKDLRSIIGVQRIQLERNDRINKEKDIQIGLYRDLSVNYTKEIVLWQRRFRRARNGRNLVIGIGVSAIGYATYRSLK